MLCQAIDFKTLLDGLYDNFFESAFCMFAELARMRVMALRHRHNLIDAGEPEFKSETTVIVALQALNVNVITNITI